MSKVIPLFFNKRTINKINETWPDDQKELRAFIQKNIAGLVKFTDQSFEGNVTILNNPFINKTLTFKEISIDNFKLTSDKDWKPTDKEMTERFEHSVRDATFNALVEFAQIRNALNAYWNDNIPDSAPPVPNEKQRKFTKDEKQKMIIPQTTCVEENIHRELYRVVLNFISEKYHDSIMNEYPTDEPKVKK